MSKLNELWDGKPGSGKFRRRYWGVDEFFEPYYIGSDEWVRGLDEDGCSSRYPVYGDADYAWEVYGNSKMETWYRPKYIYNKEIDEVERERCDFQRSKDDFDFFDEEYMVLEWEEKQFPTKDLNKGEENEQTRNYDD